MTLCNSVFFSFQSSLRLLQHFYFFFLSTKFILSVTKLSFKCSILTVNTICPCVGSLSKAGMDGLPSLSLWTSEKVRFSGDFFFKYFS